VRQEFEQTQKELQTIQANLVQQRDRLFELLSAQRPDRKAIEECKKAIAAGQEQVLDTIVEHLLRTGKRIGPERQKELLRLIRRRTPAQFGPRRGPIQGPQRPEDTVPGPVGPGPAEP
jgi:hypothetical protein